MFEVEELRLTLSFICGLCVVPCLPKTWTRAAWPGLWPTSDHKGLLAPLLSPGLCRWSRGGERRLLFFGPQLDMHGVGTFGHCALVVPTTPSVAACPSHYNGSGVRSYWHMTLTSGCRVDFNLIAFVVQSSFVCEGFTLSSIYRLTAYSRRKLERRGVFPRRRKLCGGFRASSL